MEGSNNIQYASTHNALDHLSVVLRNLTQANMTSWWVMCLVTLLYMHHSAMMAVADDPRVAPDKSTWPGRKLKDIQPETPSNGGVRDLLAQDMCLYGESQ